MVQPVSDIKAKQKKNAEKLLDNPVFQQISEELDTQYFKMWADTLDQSQRDDLWNKASGVREVLRMIKYIATEQAGRTQPVIPEYNH